MYFHWKEATLNYYFQSIHWTYVSYYAGLQSTVALSLDKDSQKPWQSLVGINYDIMLPQLRSATHNYHILVVPVQGVPEKNETIVVFDHIVNTRDDWWQFKNR
jgi:hypothetical protein